MPGSCWSVETLFRHEAVVRRDFRCISGRMLLEGGSMQERNVKFTWRVHKTGCTVVKGLVLTDEGDLVSSPQRNDHRY